MAEELKGRKGHCWEIIPGLWQGDGSSPLEMKADYAVSCAALAEIAPDSLKRLLKRPFYTLFPFSDGPKLPDLNMARAIAKTIHQCLVDGKTVLVHCIGGRNRSGLMIGLVMLELGMKNIVKHIRSRNCEAFSNTDFAAFLTESESA